MEILSPSNTRQEMERKRREYFAGGCKLYWELDPAARPVRAYTSPRRFKEIGEDGVLSGGAVLPEFKLPLAEWFDRAGQRA